MLHLSRLGHTLRTALPLLLLATACDRAKRDPARDALPIDSVQKALAEFKPTHVDSVFPPEEEVRRFILELGRKTDTLRYAAPTRDALVSRFASLVEKNDTTALRHLGLDVIEFASLYYGSSRFAKPPYFLKPQTAFFQISANSEHDLQTLMRSYGGQPFRVASYDCPAPTVEGTNRVHERCRVRFKGDTTSFQLFGSILERDGRFKFVSFANKL
jgi:hypothetical protein